jgi:WD40 repeat protein
VAVADLRVLSDGHSDRSLVAHRRVHEAEVRSVSFSPCGTALATASFAGTCRILTSGLHGDHPEYGWLTNAGYGTPVHIEAIRIHGPTPHHRKTFAPVRAALSH